MKLVTPLGTLAMNWTRVVANTCSGEQSQCAALKSCLAFEQFEGRIFTFNG